MKKIIITRTIYLNIWILLGLFLISGCGDNKNVETQSTTNSTSTLDLSEGSREQEVADIYESIYMKAIDESETDELEVIRNIVNEFGEGGYCAVDSKNQINMTNAEKVLEFCDSVEEKNAKEITIMQISHTGGYIIYNLKTQDGKVEVEKQYYEYNNGIIEEKFKGTYEAVNFKYTEEGYLMFSGDMYSEQQYLLTMSTAEEHVAMRVQPLDEECRELNRQYLLPIGFQRNNMFMVNWSQTDYGELDFYDMYDILYQQMYGVYHHYLPDDNLEKGVRYEIPKEEFETVIMTYFDIDSETLQSKTTYYPDYSTYEYRPRGFYEVEYPEYPYSEVVDYKENEDGTITLISNVVFPYTGDSKVYTHQVVVHPSLDGGVKYVSNHILTSDDSCEKSWHTPRLTREEWDEIYGDFEEGDTQQDKGYDLPIDATEEACATSDCINIMECVRHIYLDSGKNMYLETTLDEAVIEQMQEMVGYGGYSVTASIYYSDMINYENVDAFLRASQNGEPGSVVIYDVHNDGGIGRKKFVYDGKNMYVISAICQWNTETEPIITYMSHNRVEEWKYTDKGWFGYELCVPKPPEVSETMDGSCLIRVLPMVEEHRQLSKKCVEALGYKGNNLLCSNWSLDNIGQLDFNGLFEHLYRMKYGVKFDYTKYPNGIPMEEFEDIIVQYLPVTREQLRQWACFDEEKNAYDWVQLGCSNYTPSFFGTSVPEVTDVRENEDGTITLTVDAVCDMVICDEAVITHELTIRFAEDGTFKYLGNEILDNGIENIPEYQYRVKNK